MPTITLPVTTGLGCLLHFLFLFSSFLSIKYHHLKVSKESDKKSILQLTHICPSYYLRGLPLELCTRCWSAAWSWLLVVTGIHILCFSWWYFTFQVPLKALNQCTLFWCQRNGANITYVPSLLSVTLLLTILFTLGFQRRKRKNLTKEKTQRQHGRTPVIPETYSFSQKLRPRIKLTYVLALTVQPISRVTFPFFASVS